MNILVVDIGGTNVKVWRTGEADKVKFPSGKTLTPQQMVDQVKQSLDGWTYDRVSLGYPGDIQHGHPAKEPYNLGDGWVGFDFVKAFEAPTRLMNDACMQALGSYDGGRMLYVGLGTSMGTVFIHDGHIVPLSLGHLKFCCGESFEHHLSRKALEIHGEKRWRRSAIEAAEVLQAAFLADYVVLGGGNTKHLDELPTDCRRGGNHNAYFGGLKMWQPEPVEEPQLTVVAPSAGNAM